jgi:hypothetical protein
MSRMDDDDLLLPEGARLVHIGPFKTGSTSLQSALAGARPVLGQHGVAYPGDQRRQMRPTLAVLGRNPSGRRPVRIEEWDALAAEVATLGDQRVCISSEDLGSASPRQAAKVVADLGGDRVHVVAVSRRLDRLLPSQWQERVKSCDPVTYEGFLRSVLGDDQTELNHKKFWASHRISAMYDRWADAAGHANFRLIVTDDSDRTLLLRLFERMLGLPQGLLVPDADAGNPSLTANGAELVRRVNQAFLDGAWPADVYHWLLWRGAIAGLISGPAPALDDRIPPLPTWAQDRIAELSARNIKEIEDRGIQVVGDLQILQTEPAATGATAETAQLPDTISIDSAARALAGAVEGALELRLKDVRYRKKTISNLRARAESGRALDETPTAELLKVLRARVARRLLRRGPRRG